MGKGRRKKERGRKEKKKKEKTLDNLHNVPSRSTDRLLALSKGHCRASYDSASPLSTLCIKHHIRIHMYACVWTSYTPPVFLRVYGLYSTSTCVRAREDTCNYTYIHVSIHYSAVRVRCDGEMFFNSKRSSSAAQRLKPRKNRFLFF